MDVLGFLFLFLTHRKRIAVVTVVAMLLGLIIALLLKPVFTASAIILPPVPQQSTASALIGSLGSLASLGSGGAPGGLLKTPADMYIGILKSDTIADQIIRQFDLRSVYHKKTLYETRAALAKHVDFESKKDGLIHISVKDHNAQRASDIANAFINLLYRMNSTLALTEASQRRLFFGQQVEKERIALNKAEDALVATQMKTGLIQLSGQAELILRSIAQLQAQISNDQVMLDGLLSSSTEENPEVQRLRREIAALQSQLKKLQNSQSALQPGNTMIPAGRLPMQALQYEEKLRDVKYHEALFDLLTKQYEIARIDEAKSAPVIQVVDHAIPPDKKSGPMRSLIVLGSGIVGFISSCFWCVIEDAYRRMREMPEYLARMSELRAKSALKKSPQISA